MESCTNSIQTHSRRSFKVKALRSCILVFFAFSLLWKDVAAFTWNVHFYANQQELAENFCVNRNKPQLLCNGKCYLADQLKQIMQEEQQQKEKPIVPPMKLKDSEYFPTFPQLSLPQTLQSRIFPKIHVPYQAVAGNDHTRKLDRPPGIFVRS